MSPSRGVAVVFAVAAWVASGFVMLLGLLWGATLHCDDHCGTPAGWQGSPDAWQWNALAALGVLTFIAGTALVVFVWRRRDGLAATAVVVGLVSAVVLVAALSGYLP